MIAHLSGTIVHRSPMEIVLDVHGVGFQIHIPLSTYETIQHASGSVTLLTYLHVREDLLQLYGFATEAERETFRMLLAVSGIGPRMAQGILSGLRPADLRTAIQSGDVRALTAISGVGRKTAERIVLELRDKLGKTELPEGMVPATSLQLKARSEALIALMSLGYTRQNAEKALTGVVTLAKGEELSVEDLIKLALHGDSQ